MKIVPWITSAQQQIEVISQEQLIVTNAQVITSGCLNTDLRAVMSCHITEEEESLRSQILIVILPSKEQKYG